ncbi:MAG: excisionase family DNA-binding protein [Planctomycetes bacterium]|nr:excisionase family DNA-binding protein [Planctomycetota bacterium]
MDIEELVSPAIAADRLGVSRDTVLRWIRLGRLEALRMSRKVLRIKWPVALERLSSEASS